MKDPILELMVKYAEDNYEVAVTLVVQGLLITGTVISKEKYLKENHVTNMMANSIREPARTYNLDPRRRFIHLKDAQYFMPGNSPIPSDGGTVCRVSLADVAAFNFGLLKSEIKAS